MMDSTTIVIEISRMEDPLDIPPSEDDIEDNPYKNRKIGMHKKNQERIQQKRSKISSKKCPSCGKGFACKSRFESCCLCDKIQHSDCIPNKAEKEHFVCAKCKSEARSEEETTNHAVVHQTEETTVQSVEEI